MIKGSPMEFFRQITRIPRDSHDEKEISDYLMKFAEERGFAATLDDALNVVIRKPGTPGREGLCPIVLQSHVDMVYIKEKTCDHDYDSPLVLLEENGFLHAVGTSLGADNGIGMAYVLALLDSADLPHPPLEALFTTGEEVGLTGITALSADALEGRRLLNLDSEEDTAFIAGCAGGKWITITLPGVWQASAGLQSFALEVRGLRGGHSGLEIHRGRGNAIRLLARLIQEIRSMLPVAIGEAWGGTKLNAIPDRADGVLMVEPRHAAALQEVVERCQADFRRELAGTDPDIRVELTPISFDGKVLGDDVLERLLKLLLAIPIGVQTRSGRLPDVVESSNNLGILSRDGDTITVACSVRSLEAGQGEAVVSALEQVAELVGAQVRLDSAYPAWTFVADSPLREISARVYAEVFGAPPAVTTIHAGLECSYLAALYPDMDMLSFGPNITGAHTPQEAVDLASVQRVWTFLVRLMAVLE